MAKENKELRDKMAKMEKDFEQTISINKNLEEKLKNKNKEMLKLLGGFEKLLSMLLHQNSPLC